MTNGKTSAKVKRAINLVISHQADDEWRKNSPLVQKFATRLFINRKRKKAENLTRVKSPAFAF